jgi:parvulin-like peptidyl-prolyl isomerase
MDIERKINMTARLSVSGISAIIALLGLLCSFAPDLRAQEISVEAIAAIVGDEAITFAQLERRLNQRIELIGGDSFDRALVEQERPRLRRDMVKILIEESLLLQEAKRLKIEVSEAEINRELNRRIESHRERGINIPDLDALYELAFERDNMTREEVREQVSRDMTRNKLLWERVWPAPRLISPGQIKSYYRERSKEFQTPASLTFRMLVVEPSEESEFQMTAVDVALDEGRPFEEVESRFSESPILWKKKLKDLEPWPLALREVLAEMKAGEVRRRVRSSRGWHYVHMIEVEAGEVLPFAEAQELIENSIRESERRERYEEHLRKLRKRYLIENMLTDDAEVPNLDSKGSSKGEPEEAQESGDSGVTKDGPTDDKKIRRLEPKGGSKKKKKVD